MLACVRSAMLSAVRRSDRRRRGPRLDWAAVPGAVVGLPDAAVRRSATRPGRPPVLGVQLGPAPGHGPTWPTAGREEIGAGPRPSFALGLMTAGEELAGRRPRRRRRSRRTRPGRVAAPDSRRPGRWSTPCAGPARTAVLLAGRQRRQGALAAGTCAHILPAISLGQARAALKGRAGWPAPPTRPSRAPVAADDADAGDVVTDLSVVQGSPGGRRASRWPPPGAITCSWSGRRERARRSWPDASPSVLPPTARRRRGPGGDPDPLRRGAVPARTPRPGPSLPGAPPHGLGRRPRRWRKPSPVSR